MRSPVLGERLEVREPLRVPPQERAPGQVRVGRLGIQGEGLLHRRVALFDPLRVVRAVIERLLAVDVAEQGLRRAEVLDRARSSAPAGRSLRRGPSRSTARRDSARAGRARRPPDSRAWPPPAAAGPAPPAARRRCRQPCARGPVRCRTDRPARARTSRTRGDAPTTVSTSVAATRAAPPARLTVPRSTASALSSRPTSCAVFGVPRYAAVSVRGTTRRDGSLARSSVIDAASPSNDSFDAPPDRLSNGRTASDRMGVVAGRAIIQ